MEIGGESDEFVRTFLPQIPVRHERVVRLAELRVCLASNAPLDECLKFFSAAAIEDGPACDYRIVAVDSRAAPGWTAGELARFADRTYTGGRFSRGYYITDNFGAPVTIVTRGNTFHLFGTSLERVIWPFFVKYLLTVHAAEHDALHIKAAAFDLQGAGTLLIGNGGTGKTIMLAELCGRAGASFVSNTHCVLHGTSATGVLSTMRVRRDLYFASIIDGNRLPPAITTGEYILDPVNYFRRVASSIEVRNLCVVDYSRDGSFRLQEMNKRHVYNYMNQFSLANNAYSLKNQLLDYCAGDLASFSELCQVMNDRLEHIVAASRTLFVSCNILDDEHRRQLVAALAVHP
jgi:hypothetical protein